MLHIHPGRAQSRAHNTWIMINRSGRLGDGRPEWDFLNKTANKAAERIEARGLWASSQLNSEVFLREGKRILVFIIILNLCCPTVRRSELGFVVNLTGLSRRDPTDLLPQVKHYSFRPDDPLDIYETLLETTSGFISCSNSINNKKIIIRYAAVAQGLKYNKKCGGPSSWRDRHRFESRPDDLLPHVSPLSHYPPFCLITLK